MNCPECGSRNVRVCMTKTAEADITVRRRVCLACEHRWYTAQGPEYAVERGKDFKFFGRGHGERVLFLDLPLRSL